MSTREKSFLSASGFFCRSTCSAIHAGTLNTLPYLKSLTPSSFLSCRLGLTQRQGTKDPTLASMGEVQTASGSELPVVSGSYAEAGPHAGQVFSQPRTADDPATHSQASYSNPQQMFRGQFDMAQPQVPARPVPYNMTALTNALPQADYRHGPYNPSHMRYNPTGSSPSLIGQTQPLPQYNGQHGMAHMPNQAYYMQQQQMSPYYGGPISPSQPQSNMSQRQNMPYYGNQVISNHQSHPTMGYYYPPVASFASQGHPSHPGMPGSYMHGAGFQQDPRIGSAQGGDSGDSSTFSPTQQEHVQC